MELFEPEVRDTVLRALREDIGQGDLTTMSLVPADAQTRGIIHAKEAGVIAGMPVARIVFETVDPGLSFEAKVKDGERVERGTVLAEVQGSARSILIGERLALNFLQRLSGIATKTARCVELVTYYQARIVDTRKTTPGLRMLEKYAVRMGGGKNHRFGLFDGVLIKDNHIRVAGGIHQAVSQARQAVPHTVKIEVEVEDLAGVAEALEANADIIMLDNMVPELMKEAVRMIGGRALVEASGGVSEETLVEIAKTGVHLISMGALTHSVKALDISLDVEAIKRGRDDVS
ncbi:carboxylating nicotinate-nucleotide diphosphorylase [Heliobacterium undosum]|uniref:Probable nicotinate-nucleotide pyrophosphorylase [carboxylating] n=1 Tax=Heliomicrobium undosum TaxID=121734 RepID=A0A845KZ90_9FIRM|nr:carboxylating nicotinate-nucleotide diphosphorylase [Heliomicrobium undosum]MZP29347.1 carboxylating nicotinate-nucleotide diphosphorylase [Heliomicrobium undosum]